MIWFRKCSPDRRAQGRPAGRTSRGYVFQTAASVLADRARRRDSRQADAHFPFDPDRHGDEELDPHRQLSGKEDLRAAVAALLALPERTRTIFVLHRLEGQKYRDVATQLGISVSAVEKHSRETYGPRDPAFERGLRSQGLMRDIIDLRRLQAMDADTAAALLAARLSDPTGPHDVELLDEWLEQEEGHRRAWERAQRALFTIDSAGADDILAELRLAAREAGPAAGRHWPRWAMAAAVVVVLAGGAWTVTERPGAVPDQVATAPASPSTYATAKGEVRTISLPDGSTMTLDTDSAVEIAFAGNRRDLTLRRGRASFAVEHDASRPFSVRAGGHQVVALGTRFDVRLDPGLFQVVLVEGRVSVSAGSGEPVLLRAGQQLVEKAGESALVSSADGGDARSWQQGMATFHDEPLSAVAAELNRYTSDRLVVRDPRLAELRVTGVFRTGDVTRFGRTLAEIYPLRLVRKSAHEWEIVSTGGAARENIEQR